MSDYDPKTAAAPKMSDPQFAALSDIQQRIMKQNQEQDEANAKRRKDP
jgi:hypothetical protein